MSRSKYTSFFTVHDTKTGKLYNLSTRYTKNSTCILEVNGIKVASAGGGGYDKEGTCIGEWLADNFGKRLMALDCSNLSGLAHYHKVKKGFKGIKRIPASKREDKKYYTTIDGACGVSPMLLICKKLKLTVKEVY